MTTVDVILMTTALVDDSGNSADKYRQTLLAQYILHKKKCSGINTRMGLLIYDVPADYVSTIYYRYFL